MSGLLGYVWLDQVRAGKFRLGQVIQLISR